MGENDSRSNNYSKSSDRSGAKRSYSNNRGGENSRGGKGGSSYKGKQSGDRNGGGYKKRDGERGGYRGKRDDDKRGYRGNRDNDRNGYRGKRDDDNRGGYRGKRDDDKRGGYRGSRDGDFKGRDGYKKRDGERDGERGGYRGKLDGDDFKKRDDRRDNRKFEGRDNRRDDRRFNDRDDNRGSKKPYDRKPNGDRKFDRRDNDRRNDNRSNDRKDSFKPRDNRNFKAGEKPQKKRVYRSKRDFDQQKVNTLMDADNTVYHGELDPRKEERSQIAPGRKSRELKEAREDAEREKAQEERKARDRIDDESLPIEQRFYKNEASPARLAALDVTRAVRKRGAYAHELIESRIDTSNMSAADRAFATLLVLGVVSTYGTLDDVINRGMKKPTDAFDDVRDALRISTYEIIFLKKSPHAALDQGVELVRAVSPSAAGLGNAILHRILEMSDQFPFGDPNHDIEALARVYAFPKWMAVKLVEDLGAKEAAQLMHASNDPAPLFIAVNSLKATDEEVATAFENAGAQLRPAKVGDAIAPGCFHVSNPRAIADKAIRKLFDQGKILVSDASAQVVANIAFEDFQPESILEVGAGRGTKTVLLQSDANRVLGHQVELTSLDMHEFKMNLLENRADQYGIDLKETVVGNGMRLDTAVGDKKYSCVFIDAPCSGLGTLRRHPEIRWRIKQPHIQELADTGLGMLRSAASHVEVGGQIVYATCTVTYDENNGVVKRFLESPEGKDFKLVPIAGAPCFASQLTNGSPDAHFAVKFTRVQ